MADRWQIGQVLKEKRLDLAYFLVLASFLWTVVQSATPAAYCCSWEEPHRKVVQMETRDDRKERLASGLVEADDIKAFYATANRLRSMWSRIASVRLPFTEVALDTLLTAKEEAQNVVDAAQSGEKVIRALMLNARDASDPLLVPIIGKDGYPTGNFSIGLDTHEKHFTVEHRERDTVDVDAMLTALVRDGLLTTEQVSVYKAAHSKHTEYDAVSFRARGE